MNFRIFNILTAILLSMSAFSQKASDSLSTYQGQNLLQINGYQRILQNLEAVPNGMTFGGYARESGPLLIDLKGIEIPFGKFLHLFDLFTNLGGAFDHFFGR